jgi:hypothetical protein
MGYYINEDSKGNLLPQTGKAQALINDGAVITNNTFKENLVCVVENSVFDAAGYAYDEREFEVFNHPDDPRQRTWLVYSHAKKLSGYDN